MTAHNNNIILPPWVDELVKLLGAGGAFGGIYIVGLIWFGFSPKTTDVGYMPAQPVPYSHKVHAGELGLDCRYCHLGVEVASSATIPATQVCMNCHEKVLPESKLLEPVRASFGRAATGGGLPVPWVRVHDLADFAYFDHSAHVARGGTSGIGCVTCHGRVDKMETVYQAETISMGFCLECHRNPERYLRPIDKITDLAWELPEDEQLELGKKLALERGLYDESGKPTWLERRLDDCSTCHR